MTLSGKTALITGVASGSAAAIALRSKRQCKVPYIVATMGSPDFAARSRRKAPRGERAHVICWSYERTRLVERQMLLGTTADGQFRTVRNAVWPGFRRMH
jgi:hypothetical protein